MTNRFFINRRIGGDRRVSCDQRKNPRLDLSYRKRRKSDERRHCGRSVTDDFYASNNFFTREKLDQDSKEH